jgi:hypothetical protein
MNDIIFNGGIQKKKKKITLSHGILPRHATIHTDSGLRAF